MTRTAMNSFQGIQSGQGLLKTSYDDDESPLSIVMRKRADKLKEKTIEPTKNELEQNEEE